MESPVLPYTSVVVIDDDGDVRELLSAMLAASDDFELVDITSDVEEGIALVARRRPGTVVVDLEAADAAAGEVVARLRAVSPASRIVVLSAFPDPVTLLHVLGQGADHYLDKGRAWADLLPALRELGQRP
jgi:DNA-binding NarL/FixJ family response regulator